MNKTKIIRNLISTFLGIVFLLGTMGFTMDFHFCQGQIKSIGFFEKAQECNSKKNGQSCTIKTSKSAKNSISKIPCCVNKQVFYKVDFIKKIETIPAVNKTKVDPPQIYKLKLNQRDYYTFTTHNPVVRNKIIYTDKDFSVLYQSFLI